MLESGSYQLRTLSKLIYSVLKKPQMLSDIIMDSYHTFCPPVSIIFLLHLVLSAHFNILQWQGLIKREDMQLP